MPRTCPPLPAVACGPRLRAYLLDGWFYYAPYRARFNVFWFIPFHALHWLLPRPALLLPLTPLRTTRTVLAVTLPLVPHTTPFVPACLYLYTMRQVTATACPLYHHIHAGSSGSLRAMRIRLYHTPAVTVLYCLHAPLACCCCPSCLPPLLQRLRVIRYRVVTRRGLVLGCRCCWFVPRACLPLTLLSSGLRVGLLPHGLRTRVDLWLDCYAVPGLFALHMPVYTVRAHVVAIYIFVAALWIISLSLPRIACCHGSVTLRAAAYTVLLYLPPHTTFIHCTHILLPRVATVCYAPHTRTHGARTHAHARLDSLSLSRSTRYAHVYTHLLLRIISGCAAFISPRYVCVPVATLRALAPRCWRLPLRARVYHVARGLSRCARSRCDLVAIVCARLRIYLLCWIALRTGLISLLRLHCDIHLELLILHTPLHLHVVTLRTHARSLLRWCCLHARVLPLRLFSVSLVTRYALPLRVVSMDLVCAFWCAFAVWTRLPHTHTHGCAVCYAHHTHALRYAYAVAVWIGSSRFAARCAVRTLPAVGSVARCRAVYARCAFALGYNWLHAPLPHTHTRTPRLHHTRWINVLWFSRLVYRCRILRLPRTYG